MAKTTGEKDYMGKPMLTWFYAKYDMKKFLPLEEQAIKDHIDMLNRHLMDIKKKEAA